MPSVLRILDANANRAREALRVMEESARFILNDADLVDGLKNLRHDLAAALAKIEGLEANRDTPGDVGTIIKTESEHTRDTVAQVAIAAGKRLSEALRAIEEYGKLLPPLPLGEGRGEGIHVTEDSPNSSHTSKPEIPSPVSAPPSHPLPRGEGAGFSSAIEQLRYRGYDLEQRLNRAMATGRARQWKLCVLLSEHLCPGRDWWRVAQAVVVRGADCIQLREKSLDAGELLIRAGRLVNLCRPRGVSVIINDRPDVALLSNADGVHLGQTDLPCAEARKLVGRQLLIGVSTSNLAQARQAHRDGADYCGIGPMFATTTKHKDSLAGSAYLREYLHEMGDHLPGLAIGGITPDNMKDLVAAGVRGIAVSSAVCCSSDPTKTVQELLSKISL